jgi:hypothetical protein
MKTIIKLILPFLLLSSCSQEIKRFVTPQADFELPSDTVELYASVKFTNLGTGEYFSFWTGDQGHDYALKDSGLSNIGLPPNLGKDFFYSYTQSGVYQVVMVASSFNEETGLYESRTKSSSIFVKPGNDGNFIEKFALYNVEKDYSPEAEITDDSLIFFKLSRKYDIRVNTRPIRFRTNNVSAYLTAQNGDTLYSDLSRLTLYDLVNDQPILTPITVHGYFNKMRTYNILTGFYPVINSIKFTDGPLAKNITEVAGKQGVFEATIFRDGMLSTTTTLTYSTEANVTVTMDNDPTPIVSGVTEITLTGNKHTFHFSREIAGHMITSSITLSITYI